MTLFSLQPTPKKRQISPQKFQVCISLWSERNWLLTSYPSVILPLQWKEQAIGDGTANCSPGIQNSKHVGGWHKCSPTAFRMSLGTLLPASSSCRSSRLLCRQFRSARPPRSPMLFQRKSKWKAKHHKQPPIQQKALFSEVLKPSSDEFWTTTGEVNNQSISETILEEWSSRIMSDMEWDIHFFPCQVSDLYWVEKWLLNYCKLFTKATYLNLLVCETKSQIQCKIRGTDFL